MRASPKTFREAGLSSAWQALCRTRSRVGEQRRDADAVDSIRMLDCSSMADRLQITEFGMDVRRGRTPLGREQQHGGPAESHRVRGCHGGDGDAGADGTDLMPEMLMWSGGSGMRRMSAVGRIE